MLERENTDDIYLTRIIIYIIFIRFSTQETFLLLTPTIVLPSPHPLLPPLPTHFPLPRIIFFKRPHSLNYKPILLKSDCPTEIFCQPFMI
jgi:hypothetical protein